MEAAEILDDIMKKRKQNPRAFVPNSAEVVGSIDDLLTEILVKLPAKSLIRFKIASKHWLTLITNPQFCNRHTARCNNPVGGVYASIKSDPQLYQYIQICTNKHSIAKAPSINFDFCVNPFQSRILQSCNGLLLCCSDEGNHRSYYVYNPTTNCSASIPDVGIGYSCVATLVFDPMVSLKYKLVFVQFTENEFIIYIYSSDTLLWKSMGPIKKFLISLIYRNGVYWNGSVHWLYEYDMRPIPVNSIRLHVETEAFLDMPTPPPLLQDTGDYSLFTDSCNHLQFIACEDNLQRTVYEMKRDYSEWFVKYQVDLSVVNRAYPYDRINILSLIQGEGNEDSVLLLRIQNMDIRISDATWAIRFNLVDGTFNRLQDFKCVLGRRTFSYIPSLCRL